MSMNVGHLISMGCEMSGVSSVCKVLILGIGYSFRYLSHSYTMSLKWQPCSCG
jgi:hypothetical protein